MTILFVVVAIGALAPSIAAAELGTAVTVGNVLLDAGASGHVLVRVDGQGLAAYSLRIEFDPEVVHVTSVGAGEAPFSSAPTSNIDNTNGIVTFAAVAQPGAPSGSLDIARLNLEAVGTGGSSTVLHLTVLELLRDNLNLDEITPRSEVDGHASITGEPPPPTMWPLTVILLGAGTGSVVSTPLGTDCVPTCQTSLLEGTHVTLTAQPAVDSQFLGWSGVCTGTGACLVSMEGGRLVGATFVPVAVQSVPGVPLLWLLAIGAVMALLVAADFVRVDARRPSG